MINVARDRIVFLIYLFSFYFINICLLDERQRANETETAQLLFRPSLRDRWLHSSLASASLNKERMALVHRRAKRFLSLLMIFYPSVFFFSTSLAPFVSWA